MLLLIVSLWLHALQLVVAMRIPPVEGSQQAVLSAPATASNGNGEDDEWRLQGWADPRLGGGRLLDWAWKELGEPLNVIISGNSDPYILTPEGFKDYSKSIGFSSECLGLHYGDLHLANLGDGTGNKTEQYLYRQYSFPLTEFPGPIMGSCWESFAGGNHFRAWKQDGVQANSGAWFLAVSQEEHAVKNHMIVPDGYNRGRDLLVKRALKGSRWRGMWWATEVEWREDLLEEGNEGVNHGIEQDGRVAILTVIRL